MHTRGWGLGGREVVVAGLGLASAPLAVSVPTGGQGDASLLQPFQALMSDSKHGPLDLNGAIISETSGEPPTPRLCTVARVTKRLMLPPQGTWLCSMSEKWLQIA